MSSWLACKDILVIRADNLGDVLLSSPAIRAIKTSFNAKITLLCSAAAQGAAELLIEVDEVLVLDLPWIKATEAASGEKLVDLADELKKYRFDACVIFTVYSQSALPAALLAYMAGIPRRLAYSRENPYALLNFWVPDKEPYQFICHQVERDLALVAEVGAFVSDPAIKINISAKAKIDCKEKLRSTGIEIDLPLFILHAGVSEEKRRFPEDQWIELGRALLAHYPCRLLFTGTSSERSLTEYLADAIGKSAFSLGGKLSLSEFAALLDMASVVISVNTATIHLTAATKTPQVVLYAQTNPQHQPWMSKHICLEYSINVDQKSKNEVIRYVNDLYYAKPKAIPTVNEIMYAVQQLWPGCRNPSVPLVDSCSK